MGDVDWPVVGKLDGYLRSGISLGQCDVHMACYQEYFETLISRERERSVVTGTHYGTTWPAAYETMHRGMTRLGVIYSPFSSMVSGVHCLVWYVIR